MWGSAGNGPEPDSTRDRVMTKEWQGVNVDVAELGPEAEQAYAEVKAAMAMVREAKARFAAVANAKLGPVMPKGKVMVFGYKFGKVSGMLVDAKGEVKPKAQGKTLADYLAERAGA